MNPEPRYTGNVAMIGCGKGWRCKLVRKFEIKNNYKKSFYFFKNQYIMMLKNENIVR